MPAPRVHLIAPAGPCTSFYRAIGAETGEQLVQIVRESVGNDYRVTARTRLFDATEDELAGGRTDDSERAEDIQSALADSAVAAIITLRGGAWFTRILPRIDFSVMDRRTTPVSFFGFSELTPLANIIAAHPWGRGYYDMGPAFLAYGLRRRTEQNLHVLEPPPDKCSDAALSSPLPKGGHGGGERDVAPVPAPQRKEPTPPDGDRSWIDQHFRAFFRRSVKSIEGTRHIRIEAQRVRGPVPLPAGKASSAPNLSDAASPIFVGGNLTVLSTMIGSRYESAVAPDGKWLVLEDYNDKPERFDRFLAHFTLAGFFDRCEGILLGDFHWQHRDLLGAVLEMLRFHISDRPDLPILHAPTVGHTWPMQTLPLHAPARVEHRTTGTVILSWP